MRTAIYTRVSTDQQADEGFSLEAQHDQLLNYAQRNKLEVFKIYTDPGISAKNLNRPGVQEMIRDVENGIVEVILVHKLDRLTRNIADLHNLVELVNRKNVKLISITESIDTSTPSGRMFVYFLGIFAQMFRENLAEEVRKGMSARTKKGFHNVTVNLYGYERQKDGRLIVKEDEAKWVKWIFNQYINGTGSTNLALKLNEMGVRRNQGARWDQHKIMMTLRNYHYIGKVHWKAADKSEDERIIQDGSHEPIIPMEIFERVQRIIERRREGFMSRTSYDYVFSGIIKCGKCGGKYKGKYNKRINSNLYRGYECSNRYRYGTCDQSGISEAKMIKLLFKTIPMDYEEAERHLANYFVEEEPESNMREEIETLIAQSEARRSRWQIAYGDGFMPYDDFAKRMKEEMEKVAELERKLEELPQSAPSSLTAQEIVNTLRNIKENWDYFEPSTRKSIIQSMFQEIEITKSEKEWKITSITLA